MKGKLSMLVILVILGTGNVFAKSKTEKFEVKGNCESCEKRIETAALSVEGVSKADWNKDTKMMDLVMDDSKTDVMQVETAIAKAGHDTPMQKASDEAYGKLPGCCQYDRSEKMKKDDTGCEKH